MVPPGAAASSVLWASLAITHACCSCLLLLHAPVYSLNVAMLSSWVFVFFFFLVLGSWLKLSLPAHALCPYCLSCVV